MYEYFLKLKIISEIQSQNISKFVECNLDDFESFQEFINLILKEVDLKISPRKCLFEIFYEEEWIKLVDLRSFYFFVSHNVHLQKEIEIKITEHEKKDYDLFDIDGIKYKTGTIDDSILPKDEKYDRSSKNK